MRNKMIYMAAALLCLAACTKTKVSDLQLDGDCLVTALSLDGYEGNIDLASRSIVVRLPEVYETSAMEVTSLPGLDIERPSRPGPDYPLCHQ